MLTSACTSTSSGREPSIAHSTADPGDAVGPLGQEQRRRVGHRLQAGAGHLEHAELADGAEAVLHRAHDAMRVMALAFEVQHRVDDVLERLGAGQAPSLVTWPTRNVGTFWPLAANSSCVAASRTWPTLPGADWSFSENTV